MALISSSSSKKVKLPSLKASKNISTSAALGGRCALYYSVASPVVCRPLRLQVTQRQCLSLHEASLCTPVAASGNVSPLSNPTNKSTLPHSPHPFISEGHQGCRRILVLIRSMAVLIRFIYFFVIPSSVDLKVDKLLHTYRGTSGPHHHQAES